jgi:hypothetical protein
LVQEIIIENGLCCCRGEARGLKPGAWQEPRDIGGQGTRKNTILGDKQPVVVKGGRKKRREREEEKELKDEEMKSYYSLLQQKPGHQTTKEVGFGSRKKGERRK